MLPLLIGLGVLGLLYIVPGINESAPGPCAALEYRVANDMAAAKASGSDRVFAAIIFGAVTGATHGQIAANYVRSTYPAIPPSIACAALYWRMVVSPARATGAGRQAR